MQIIFFANTQLFSQAIRLHYMYTSICKIKRKERGGECKRNEKWEGVMKLAIYQGGRGIWQLIWSSILSFSFFLLKFAIKNWPLHIRNSSEDYFAFIVLSLYSCNLHRVIERQRNLRRKEECLFSSEAFIQFFWFSSLSHCIKDTGCLSVCLYQKISLTTGPIWLSFSMNTVLWEGASNLQR